MVLSLSRAGPRPCLGIFEFLLSLASILCSICLVSWACSPSFMVFDVFCLLAAWSLASSLLSRICTGNHVLFSVPLTCGRSTVNCPLPSQAHPTSKSEFFDLNFKHSGAFQSCFPWAVASQPSVSVEANFFFFPEITVGPGCSRCGLGTSRIPSTLPGSLLAIRDLSCLSRPAESESAC